SYESQSIERVIAIGCPEAARVDLSIEVAVRVVGVRRGARFGIGGAGQAREGVVGEGALARAVLNYGEQIIERVVAVGGDVTEAAGIFCDLGEAAKTVGRALALLASLVCNRGRVSRVGGEHGIGGLRTWARATRGQRAVRWNDEAGPTEGV